MNKDSIDLIAARQALFEIGAALNAAPFAIPGSSAWHRMAYESFCALAKALGFPGPARSYEAFRAIEGIGEHTGDE